MTSAGSGASVQLYACENIKYLPMLLLGLLKHVRVSAICAEARLRLTVFVIPQVGLRQSSQIPSDMRAYAQALLTTLPSQLLVPYLYPTLYSLHNMPKEVRPSDRGPDATEDLPTLHSAGRLESMVSFCRQHSIPLASASNGMVSSSSKMGRICSFGSVETRSHN